MRPAAQKLAVLGYHVAVLLDNDAPEHFDRDDVKALRAEGIHVCQWQPGHSTETQLLAELPLEQVVPLLRAICGAHDTLAYATTLDAVRTASRLRGVVLGEEPAAWTEHDQLRGIVGELARKSKWMKRIDYAQNAFSFALPFLSAESVMATRLGQLWEWIQHE